MTTSLLQKFVLTPVLLAATVFATLSVPLIIFGKEPVTIQFQEEPLFSGKLRDISSPYLGLAGVLSLGVGFAAVAVAGWRRSMDKSSLVEAQLLNLSQNIQQKETQLEALKITDLQLEKSELKAFVDEPIQVSNIVQATSFVEPLIITTQEFQSQVILSYQDSDNCLENAQLKPTVSVSLAPKEVEELHAQLQQVMSSVQTILTAMETEAMSAKTPPVTQSWVVKDTAF
ncbi:MAG: hypothetical protein WBG73_17350 [Coleofasciculaceae cyanobacterium]